MALTTGLFLIVARRRRRDEKARLEAVRRIAFRSYTYLRRASGFQVRLRGSAPPDGALLAPNHTGYADILALGSCVPVFFVPKAEIASWPVIGALVRMAGNVMTVRKASRALSSAAQGIAQRLRCGCSVCVFLEGTSSGGDGVLPFRSSFLQPAIDTGAPIVPVAIRWASADPDVVPSEDIAYWKNHTFGPHFLRFLGLRDVYAEITFGPAILPQAGQSRKELAASVQGRVEGMLETPPAQAHGRPSPAAPLEPARV